MMGRCERVGEWSGGRMLEPSVGGRAWRQLVVLLGAALFAAVHIVGWQVHAWNNPSPAAANRTLSHDPPPLTHLSPTHSPTPSAHSHPPRTFCRRSSQHNLLLSSKSGEEGDPFLLVLAVVLLLAVAAGLAFLKLTSPAGGSALNTAL